MTWLDLSCAPNKHNTFDHSPCDGTMLSALEVTLHLISLAILNGSYCYSPHVTGEEQELRGVESFAKGVKSRLSTWAWACLCLTNLWIIVHLWQRALTWMGFFRKDLEVTFPVRWNACSPLPPYSFCPSLPTLLPSNLPPWWSSEGPWSRSLYGALYFSFNGLVMIAVK